MKHVFFIIILLVSLLVINNLLRSIISLSQKQSLISHAQKQLEKEKKDHEKLQQQYTQVNNQHFIEEQARDKLFMVKQGEQMVIVPKDLVSATDEARIKIEKKTSPITEWISLFFKQEE
ncbi:hypothetical protein BH11PAT1_BH11PAT1_0440 [soil metagenome]